MAALTKEEFLNLSKVLDKFHKKTMQVVRIKKGLDDRKYEVLVALDKNITDNGLLEQLRNINHREEKVKDIARKGLFAID